MNSIEQFIVDEYKKGKSTYQICESLALAKISNFYPNKINRILKKVGVKLRSRSESQANSLKTGRTKHPTKGKERSFETKLKISNGVSDAYQDPKVREKRSELSREMWGQMTDKQKNELKTNAAKAVRASAEEGSKIERYLLYELRRSGYEVIFHSSSLIPNQSLQIDIYLPEIKTVIEIDGISHFKAVWGEESLARAQRADSEKNGLCLQYFNVIRLQAFSNKVTGAYCRKTLLRLIPKLIYIKENTTKKSKGLLPFEERLIFIKEDQ